jgi:hypothetical protein
LIALCDRVAHRYFRTAYRLFVYYDAIVVEKFGIDNMKRNHYIAESISENTRSVVCPFLAQFTRNDLVSYGYFWSSFRITQS